MSDRHDVTFVTITDDRKRIYTVTECEKGHIHATFELSPKKTVDLLFETPEAAYDFASSLLVGYDRATAKR